MFCLRNKNIDVDQPFGMPSQTTFFRIFVYPKSYISMKKIILLVTVYLIALSVSAGTVEKTFTFNNYTIKNQGLYTTISFDQTLLSGKQGEPVLPYQSVSLILPPGEVALSMEVTGENETSIPGVFSILPQQQIRPISSGSSGEFIKNETIYRSGTSYPVTPQGTLITQYLNGYAFALSTFTPLRYVPSTGTVSYFRQVHIKITTRPEGNASGSLRNLISSVNTDNRVKAFAQNPEALSLYSKDKLKKSNYQMMIITPSAFQNGFNDLISFYSSIGLEAHVFTTEGIYSQASGIDNQEKIRNTILSEYQNNGVEYVLLGGGTNFVPARGFYCYVESGTGYWDEGIPADLYYSGMDGNYDANMNQQYGEVDDEPDMLPDVAVGRFPFSNAKELAAMVHKTVFYQAHPVLGEMKKPLMAGEFLWNDPQTWGGDYIDLLIDDHKDNGYFTHGIPSGSYNLDKLYDTPVYAWDSTTIFEKINEGTSFIHHLGHASTTYMLRMNTNQVDNAHFASVNGVTHNYTILYTQGCYCGAFDQAGCIAVKSVTIDNFLVAGIFNSRYGWFDQGTTEGPSEHLQREFVSALFTDTLPEKHIGTTHLISKIKTAPWVTVPGEFEPGAQRWCHYCCNLLGDPALSIWTDEPVTGIEQKKNTSSFTLFPNPAKDYFTVRGNLTGNTEVQIQVTNIVGQAVTPVTTFPLQTKGEHSFVLQLPKLTSGIYLVKIATSSFEEVIKLTVQ
jgi:hypothetical protein